MIAKYFQFVRPSRLACTSPIFPKKMTIIWCKFEVTLHIVSSRHNLPVSKQRWNCSRKKVGAIKQIRKKKTFFFLCRTLGISFSILFHVLFAQEGCASNIRLRRRGLQRHTPSPQPSKCLLIQRAQNSLAFRVTFCG